jgi:hypothetical protein
MAKRYHRGNQKPLEEEQTIQWIKDTTEVIRSLEEEASGYLCGIFEPLYYLFFLTASDYLCGIF